MSSYRYVPSARTVLKGRLSRLESEINGQTCTRDTAQRMLDDLNAERASIEAALSLLPEDPEASHERP